jgi:hypothetical protein
VRRRAGFEQRFGDGFVGSGPKSGRQFGQQIRDVIVECGCVELPRCRELADLRPPAGQQGLALLID